MRLWRATLIASGLALGLVLTAHVTKIDLVKLDLRVLETIERHEIDDIFSGLCLVLLALPVDLAYRRKRQKAELEAQKLRTLQATMRTVHGIVNKFLDDLLLFELEVQHKVPSRSLDRLDELIRDTHEKLKTLAEVRSVPERSLAPGTSIELPQMSEPGSGQAVS